LWMSCALQRKGDGRRTLPRDDSMVRGCASLASSRRNCNCDEGRNAVALGALAALDKNWKIASDNSY
jgi:hypothetical protein